MKRIRQTAIAGLLVGLASACASADATPSAVRTADEPPAATQEMGHSHHNASLPPLADRRARASTVEGNAADQLLDATQKSLAQWESEPAARAAGFVPASDGLGLVHYRSRANRRDSAQLDPDRPEGLVYFRNRAGQLRLLGAVFTVRAGEPAPTPGGEIFQWHTHDPSCGSFLIEPGQCSGTFRMLHLWTTTTPPIADPWMPHIRDARGS